MFLFMKRSMPGQKSSKFHHHWCHGPRYRLKSLGFEPANHSEHFKTVTALWLSIILVSKPLTTFRYLGPTIPLQHLPATQTNVAMWRFVHWLWCHKLFNYLSSTRTCLRWDVKHFCLACPVYGMGSLWRMNQLWFINAYMSNLKWYWRLRTWLGLWKH